MCHDYFAKVYNLFDDFFVVINICKFAICCSQAVAAIRGEFRLREIPP